MQAIVKALERVGKAETAKGLTVAPAAATAAPGTAHVGDPRSVSQARQAMQPDPATSKIIDDLWAAMSPADRDKNRATHHRDQVRSRLWPADDGDL